jgi:hypothetical protein
LSEITPFAMAIPLNELADIKNYKPGIGEKSSPWVKVFVEFSKCNHSGRVNI